MIARLIESGGKSYRLLFTLSSVVQAQERLCVPFETLFTSGPAGACGLLYAGLIACQPEITLDAAAKIYQSAPEDVMEAALLAFADSGFEKTGATRAEAERLLHAAAKAGIDSPERLEQLPLRDIRRALDAHLNTWRLRLGGRGKMNDDDMQRALLSFARRHNDDNA